MRFFDVRSVHEGEEYKLAWITIGLITEWQDHAVELFRGFCFRFCLPVPIFRRFYMKDEMFRRGWALPVVSIRWALRNGDLRYHIVSVNVFICETKLTKDVMSREIYEDLCDNGFPSEIATGDDKIFSDKKAIRFAQKFTFRNR